MNYIVTRHTATQHWLQKKMPKAQCLNHIDQSLFKPGDTVWGVLPLSIIAQLNQQGVRFVAVEILVPEQQRGKELNAKEFNDLQPKLIEYSVLRKQEVPLD